MYRWYCSFRVFTCSTVLVCTCDIIYMHVVYSILYFVIHTHTHTHTHTLYVICIFTGQLVDCIVESKNTDTKLVTLRLYNQRKDRNEVITKGHKLTFNALIPGLMVNVTVAHVLEVRAMV